MDKNHSCTSLIAGLDMHAIKSCLTATPVALVLCVIVLSSQVHGSITVGQACVQLTASVSEEPKRIVLNWQPDAAATSYQIARKRLGAETWQVLSTLDGTATNWTDTDFSLGEAYEYQAIKATSSGYTGYGYICSGINYSFPVNGGNLNLLVTK
jgi:hypothetical protein